MGEEGKAYDGSPPEKSKIVALLCEVPQPSKTEDTSQSAMLISDQPPAKTAPCAALVAEARAEKGGCKDVVCRCLSK